MPPKVVSVSGISSDPGMISYTTPLKATTLSGGVLGFSGDVATLLLAVMFNVARKLDTNRPPV